jgi:hypothetical protein
VKISDESRVLSGVVMNTGVICLDGNLTVSGCVIGSGAAVTVNGDDDD